LGELNKDFKSKDAGILELEQNLHAKYAECEELKTTVDQLQYEMQSHFKSFETLSDEYKSMIETKEIIETKNNEIETNYKNLNKSFHEHEEEAKMSFKQMESELLGMKNKVIS